MDRVLSAPEPLAHSVLVALCDDNHIQTLALQYLTELQDYAAALDRAPSKMGDASGGEGGGGGPGSSNPNPLKRKSIAQPPQLCIQCKRAFTLGDNSPTACLHHTGEMDINRDSEVWDDWDEDVYGMHDSPESKAEYPEGFTWSCCKENGTRPGCTKGYHLAIRNNQFKRFRMLERAITSPGVDRVFEGRLLRPNEFVNESLAEDSWEASNAPRDWAAYDMADNSGASEGDENDQ
ncbi:hypothetical protein M406DRAFT_325508 [Cryphonectria parasitica EP155]|uniref:C2H2-type domain-containing protein n=1 Tax=Cryphonectria parasitica (strain ATCC 38755 / EP155) TaxID=660469 RepID=A0A9P4YBK8_CRYP1|nr:uncharacterized protein M406DRAFT_325508 [Cryphonectria parasitica EP155]KAF3770035.1 hypothetical protein M406DRAFT_325508 [Cryphonectria parasitica EP155]